METTKIVPDNSDEIFEPEIRIKTLSAINFRGFEKITVSFDSGLNVIIGENGSGKTSILDCTAKIVSVFVQTLQGEKISSEKIFDIFDMKYGSSETSVNAVYSYGNQDICFDIIFSKEDSPEIRPVSGMKQLRESVNDKIRHQKAMNLPLFAYYPAVDAPLDFNGITGGLPTGNIFRAYDGILSRKSFDFRSFFMWYKWQVNIESQIGENKILNAARNAVYSILSDDSNKFDSLFINWINHPEGEMLINKNNVPLNISQLSSGEKFLLVLVTDLARRLAIANPNRENPLSGFGIILIDEVDLHLHPAWQRVIVPKLQRTFPECQFIVTTHSPMVLSGVRPQHVIILNNFRVLDNTPHTFGRDANSILYELMDVRERPEEIQVRIDEIYELTDEHELEKAKNRLRKLSEDLGENDVEIVRAYTHINFMEEMD